MLGRRPPLALAAALLAATTGCATQPAATSPAATTRPTPQAPSAVNDVVVEQALFGSGTRVVDVTPRVVHLLRTEPADLARDHDQPAVLHLLTETRPAAARQPSTR